MDGPLFPRHVERHLTESLTDSPVVLVHGPRQCGKSTLARIVGNPLGYAYVTFDDDTLRSSANADPVAFIGGLPEKTILDEIQRVPELFTTLKAAVDRRRAPGRFLLTGSASVLLLPKLADSLAGRMGLIRLHPLSQAEIENRPATFLTRLFLGHFPTRSATRLGVELIERIVSGGYPAALARANPRRKKVWYRDYIETLIQRDVQDLIRIRNLDVLPRLLSFAASQTAQLFNASELASPFQVSRPTVQEYLTLLERIFLVERLPPWHSNRISRLIKTPKLHLTDSGVACALLGYTTEMLASDRTLLGPLLETFVYQELRRLASGDDEDHGFFHFRHKDGAEVDIVIERGIHEVAGVEVKASATARQEDFRGLIKLRDAIGKQFRAGVVLYDGETTTPFGDRLYAVPIRTLWEA